ncbi:MAG TPA: helix-turn-helix domain-containing protein [Candidatus Lachnoclostridium stercoravium]|uniref:Helix-turn-helix domain-containing protein n=1 Tax=Candidatus Lachnoclostridium stercoravium TaxID=2838633 RepID=A0A9D2HFY1_9FIRM|nr:helix-turn-helix domain-containing protein [Candidatus Lachnoclostridium stercoravium]
MDNKSTDDLKQELMSDPDIDSYIRKNESCFVSRSVTELLTEFYERRNMTKSQLARKSNMSEVYLHQVFAGRRKPSRNKILCMCIGMELSIEDTQRLLKEAAYAQLYPRIRREAIIYHGIVHHTPLDEINDKLFEADEKALF